MFKFLSALLILTISSLSHAAETKRPPRPAPVVSPLIDENRNVTFQLAAPQATKVSVSGEMMDGSLDLTKNDKGLWTGTLESVAPGLYGYSFSVDGVKMLDPGNPALKPMRSPKTSILHLPGDLFYDFREVPHGTVHSHSHFSKPIQRLREFRVYTPPGYETSMEAFPLLVLQHGHSDSFATWIDYGKAHWILDNLIAEGKAPPMIVLMLDGHPIPESYGNGRMPENTEELRRDLMEATLPLVESTYRLKPGRENRAIAGLSMGGLHALTIGFSELDTFATIGSFSGAIPEPEVIAKALSDSATTNEKLDLLWIACGEKDFLLDENKALIDRLKEGGIEHEWHLTEGAHEWSVWRRYLADFAPRLFP